jgi:hypothetical protein
LLSRSGLRALTEWLLMFRLAMRRLVIVGLKVEEEVLDPGLSYPTWILR